MYTEECQCKYFNIKVNTSGVNPSVCGGGGRDFAPARRPGKTTMHIYICKVETCAERQNILWGHGKYVVTRRTEIQLEYLTYFSNFYSIGIHPMLTKQIAGNSSKICMCIRTCARVSQSLLSKTAAHI